jgi:hypothetical protein
MRKLQSAAPDRVHNHTTDARYNPSDHCDEHLSAGQIRPFTYGRVKSVTANANANVNAKHAAVCKQARLRHSLPRQIRVFPWHFLRAPPARVPQEVDVRVEEVERALLLVVQSASFRPNDRPYQRPQVAIKRRAETRASRELSGASRARVRRPVGERRRRWVATPADDTMSVFSSTEGWEADAWHVHAVGRDARGLLFDRQPRQQVGDSVCVRLCVCVCVGGGGGSRVRARSKR